MTKLVGQKSVSGDMVRATQQMSGDLGFAAISRKWLDQTLEYDQAIEKIVDEQRQRVDINAKANEVSVNINNNHLVLSHADGRQFTFTDHSIKQCATWFDVPITMIRHYVEKRGEQKDLELVCRAFQLGHERIDQDKEFLFRTYSDGTLRAMLSDRYECINNLWIMEQFQELLPGGRISHARYNDADTLFCNVLIPDSLRVEDDGEYGGLLSLGNSEIGVRKFDVIPSLIRSCCMNGCLHGQVKGTSISKVHKGIDLNELRLLLVNHIDTQIPLIPSAIDKFLNTRRFKIETQPSKLLAQLCLDYKLDQRKAGEVVRQFSLEQTDKTLFRTIAAFTRAGQEFERETWFEFDKIGGDLMNLSTNGWARLQDRARILDKNDMVKVYGVAV